jgi:predicted transcriptional regulator
MPDDASTDDIIERIIFIKKIEDGLKDVEEGRVFSHDEVKTKYQQWLRK